LEKGEKKVCFWDWTSWMICQRMTRIGFENDMLELKLLS